MNFQEVVEKSKLFQYRNIIFITVIIIIVVKCVYKLLQYWAIKKTSDGTDDYATTERIKNDVVDNDEIYTPALKEKDHILYKGVTISLPDGAQQFYEMMQNRRSIRAFKPIPIPSIDVIKKCVMAAGTAPSGAHTEPWTFCIIKNDKIKLRIREIVEYEEELNYNQRMNRQWTTDLRPLKTNFIKSYLTDAPYIIAIFKQIYGFTKAGKRKQHYYNEISVSIATGILLCAFQSAGLSSLVTTPLNCGPSIRNLLKRPSNEKLLVLLPVGYPADECWIPDLSRKPLYEIMTLY